MQEINSQNNPETFLDEIALSVRWDCSVRTLQQNRWKGKGCAYTKIGRLVRYSMTDVLAYESKRHRITMEGDCNDR